MWRAIVGALVRTFAAALSGYLVGKGVDAATAAEIVGAIGVVAVAGASIYDKKKTSGKLSELEQQVAGVANTFGSAHTNPDPNKAGGYNN